MGTRTGRWSVGACALGLATLALTACDQGGPSSGDEAGPADGKADEARVCPDGPVSYEDPGDDASAVVRAQHLQAYAEALLTAKACELEGDLGASAKPLDDYRIVVNADACLGERLERDGDHDQMDRQIESVIQFLEAFHIDMEGQPTSLFHTVHFCDKGFRDNDLHLDLDGGILTVGASYSWFGEDGIGMAPKNGQRIRDWWQDGRHIDHREDVKAWNDVMFWDGTDDLWQMLDPVGDARLALRDRIVAEVSDVLVGLGWDGTEVDTTPTEVANLAQDSLRGPRDAGRNVRACVIGYAQTASQRDIDAFAGLWAAAMDRPSGWEAVAEGLIVASQPTAAIADRSIAERCATADFDEIGLVGIDVRTYLGEHAHSMLDYLGVAPGDTYADGEAACHYRIEDVDTVVSADKAVATAAADHALHQQGVDCAAVAIEEEPEPDPDAPDGDGGPDGDSAGDSEGDSGKTDPDGDTDGGTDGEPEDDTDGGGDDDPSAGDDSADPDDGDGDDDDGGSSPFDPDDDEDDEDDEDPLAPFEDIPEEESEGAGCRVGADAPHGTWLALLGLGLLGWRRRPIKAS